MENIKSIKTKELVAWYHNATKTYYKCNGHYKAKMNKDLMDKYQVELKTRGVDISEEFDEKGNLIYGVFNGNGTY